jgi:hypothetical protein
MTADLEALVVGATSSLTSTRSLLDRDARHRSRMLSSSPSRLSGGDGDPLRPPIPGTGGADPARLVPAPPCQSQYNRRLRSLVELISAVQLRLARWLDAGGVRLCDGTLLPSRQRRAV